MQQIKQHLHAAKPWLLELTKFTKAFFANPKAVGAITPSSAALGRAITRGIAPNAGKVLELGSGTGVFSRELLLRGVPASDLILVEPNPSLARTLQQQFPNSVLLAITAQQVCPQAHSALHDVAATVCGLPLRNMRSEEHLQILNSAFAVMQARAPFYLFTYGARCPIRSSVLEQCGLVASHVQFVMRNVPPASIYRLVKAT